MVVFERRKEFTLALGAGATLLLAAKLWLRKRVSARDRFEEVPNSWFHSVQSQLGPANRHVVEKLEEWSEKHGKEGFFEMNLAGSRILVCCTWEEAQPILALRPYKMIQSSTLSKCEDILAGLVFSEGKKWQRERRLIAPVFNAKNMESYIPAVEHVTQQLLTELDKDMSAQGSANLTELLLFFGADVFSKTSLGEDLRALESRKCKVFADVKALSLAFRRRLMWRLPYWKIPWLARWIDSGADASERMHETLEETMRKARASGNTKSTIGQKLTEMVGDRFSRRELLDNLTLLFMGGAETTSTVLGWAFYHLARDQELQEQVAKEVTDLPLPDGTTFLSFAQLKSLLWVQAVWLEALRCHGPAGYMPLEAAEQLTLLGRKVPAGTSVWIATRNILMNDPEVTKRLGDDLHLYRPSRWLGKEGIFDFAPFNDLGYGHGPRICVGMPLANYEAQLVIARVIHLFVLDWGKKAPLEQFTYGITCNMPSEAVSINLRHRN